MTDPGEGPPTSWLAASDPDPFPAPDALPPAADVVVIGGGLMGVSAAYWLARRGGSVLLLEARRLAWGASGRNAGIHLAGLQAMEDDTVLRKVIGEEGFDPGYRRTGHLSLATSAGVWEQFRAEVARRPATATPLHALDRAACADLLRMRIAPHFAGGRWMPDGHVIQPARLVHGLAAAAQRYGVRIATRTRALRVVAGRRAGMRVRTTRGTVEAGQVVYACNAEVTRFCPTLARFIRPVRGQVLATAPLPALFGPGMATDFGSVYWRQASDGSIVIGGCRSASASDDADERLDLPVQRALENFLPAAFPGFPRIEVRRRWAGVMDQTADGRPVIGAVPWAQRQWVIAGFGGHGMPPGIAAGAGLAEAMDTGCRTGPAPAFDPARAVPGMERQAEPGMEGQR
ncbi:NAD(P)/FAD-dependent oxidoreductase [Couchioplanes caeruleus]|uniref:Oxidoreductase n=2 Tax=Couchioplanes caeruleus TaxID=56438 RepID=A0A1K0FTP7_9ACTN|nr:FAD-dependent oxidoreductase [Couchioplanes caeruleus]OJF16239.1 Oxidoreductase [Couchioplanes caeruleus subsp. caeruleus]ROP28792.1 sarcosine oxidase subunit beta [Couchioplanes caeruleus]